MLAAKHAARLMKPAGAGVMIFTSSTSGLYGTPFRAPYVAAKWGVIGLMKTVAMELGPHGIRANAICPGSVNGPRIDRVIEAEAEAKGMTPDAVRQGYASGTALKRLSRPRRRGRHGAFPCLRRGAHGLGPGAGGGWHDL